MNCLNLNEDHVDDYELAKLAMTRAGKHPEHGHGGGHLSLLFLHCTVQVRNANPNAMISFRPVLCREHDIDSTVLSLKVLYLNLALKLEFRESTNGLCFLRCSSFKLLVLVLVVDGAAWRRCLDRKI